LQFEIHTQIVWYRTNILSINTYIYLFISVQSIRLSCKKVGLNWPMPGQAWQRFFVRLIYAFFRPRSCRGGVHRCMDSCDNLLTSPPSKSMSFVRLQFVLTDFVRYDVSFIDHNWRMEEIKKTNQLFKKDPILSL
jgi:hypothetical protein